MITTIRLIITTHLAPGSAKVSSSSTFFSCSSFLSHRSGRMLHNRLGRIYIYLWCTCLHLSYKNSLLKYKLMSYPFRVQFDRRGRGGWRSGPGGKEWAGWEGVARGRSRSGRIGLLYFIYPYFQDFLFDFSKRFQETEPFHFRSSSIIDYSETFWQFIPGD